MDSGSPCRVLGADDVNTPDLDVRSGVLARGKGRKAVRPQMTAVRLLYLHQANVSSLMPAENGQGAECRFRCI